jgi:peptide chain release factor 3
MRGSRSTCSTRRATRISARTPTAVDSAVMVLDAAPKGTKGASRSRPASSSRSADCGDVPIITFVNKLDREGRDPFDPRDEIEQSLALDVTPPPGRSAWGATFSAPMTCSPMRSHCSSAASTTTSSRRSAAAGSTTRNCCGSYRKPLAKLREEVEAAADRVRGMRASPVSSLMPDHAWRE